MLFLYSCLATVNTLEFRLEAQACIIADYFWLIAFGRSNFEAVANFEGLIGPDLLAKYEWVMRGFLCDPSAKRNLP